MRTLIHVVGGKESGGLDLLASGGFVAAFDDFVGDPGALYQQIHPLESLLLHAEQQLEPASRSRLVLVATRQDPPHPNDTADVASAYQRAFENDPSLLEEVDEVVVALVESFGLATCRDAVLSVLYGEDVDEVVLGASGAPTLQIGVALAALRMRRPITVLPTNRQDRAFDEEPVRLDVGTRLARRLCRTRDLEFAAPLLDADQAGVVGQLAAWQQLDWDRCPDFRPDRRSVPADRYADLLDAYAAYAATLDSDDELAMLASPVAETAFNEQLERLTPLERNRLLAACRKDLIKKHNERPGRPEIKKLDGAQDRLLDGRDWLSSWHRGRGAVDAAFRETFDQAALEVIEQAKRLHAEGNEPRHGRPRRGLGVAVDRFLEARADRIAERLGEMGLPMSTGADRVLIRAVGKREEEASFDAVLRERVRGETTLVRFHSDETKAGPAAGWSRVVDALIDAHDLARASEMVEKALDDLPGTGVGTITVGVAPGTAVMNLALVLGAAAVAFEHDAELRVLELRRNGEGTLTRNVEEANDDVLGLLTAQLKADLLHVALDQSNPHRVQRLLGSATAPETLARLRDAIDFARLKRPGRALVERLGFDDNSNILRSRLNVQVDRAAARPWDAVMRFSAIAEQMLDDPWGAVLDERDRQRFYELRTHNPLNHSPFTSAPPDLQAVLRRVASVLDPDGPNRQPVRDALEGLR